MYHMCKCLVIDVDTFIKLVGLGCFQFNYDKIFICFSLTYVIYSASMTTVSSTQQTPFVITRPIITDVNKQKTTVKIEVALRFFILTGNPGNLQQFPQTGNFSVGSRAEYRLLTTDVPYFPGDF